MNWIFNKFAGRSTFFAFVFMTCGIILAFIGKLNASYLGLAGSIQTLLVGRAIMDDQHDRETKKIEQANGNKPQS